MQLNATPSPVDISQYPQYVHNCNRSACEPSWTAPIPAIPYLQLYVDFGQYMPVLYQIYIQDHCDGAPAEQIFPSNYVVGQTPEGNWYGVFKYFNTPVQDISTFIVWLSVFVDSPAGFIEKTFFSEMITIEPCAPLTKIKACQPEGATTTGFDINGLYYGQPVNADYLGVAEVRYFHIAYVRQGKAREIAPKASFTGSITRNFRTTVDKNWILETELVPKWYKDVLLAIYARGAIEVAGVKYLVSDLAMDPLNDDDLTWKPYANLKATHRLYFGCDESLCVECCSPVMLNAFTTFDPESPGDESPESPSEPELVPLAWQYTDVATPDFGIFSIVVNGIQQVVTAVNASGTLNVPPGAEIDVTLVGPSGTIRTLQVDDDTTATQLYQDSAESNQTFIWNTVANHEYSIFASLSNA